MPSTGRPALATRLLPADKRPFVHALYGLARYADEIVDRIDPGFTLQQRADALDRWSEVFPGRPAARAQCGPGGCRRGGHSGALVHPDRALRGVLPPMRMDLTVEQYRTYDDLYEYVYGSAAVIGLQMVPILQPRSERAYAHARDLGVAFQLANFIRDVGEDLQRRRIYLPLAELEVHGVTGDQVRAGRVDDNWREALAEQIGRVRMLQASANPGIGMLDPASQPCIAAASEPTAASSTRWRPTTTTSSPGGPACPCAGAWQWRTGGDQGFAGTSLTSEDFTQMGGPERGSRSTPRRPQRIHSVCDHRIIAKPNRRSSTGA